MIRWYVSPDLLSDADLLREYGETTGDDDRVTALFAEIKQRALDVPSAGNALAAGRMQLATLEKRLPEMTDEEVRRGYNQCEVESPEADLYAGEMERRDLDD